jgi:hypothetical protein
MNFIMTTSGYILRLKDSIFTKINNLVNPGSRLNAANMLVEARHKPFTKETALHMLLDQGKSYHEAELVIATMQEWGLPLEHVAILDFEVHGNSVWIKPD